MKSNFSKALLTNGFIFLFCVFFVNGYTQLFGSENSTIAITLLTTLFIFLKNNLSFNTKEASFCIPLLLCLVVIAPKLALMYPVLSFPINFIAIGLLLIISSNEVAKDNHVPFLLGYIFSESYNVSGRLFELRVISVVIIGTFIGLMYYGVHKKETHTLKFIDLFKCQNLASPNTKWYLKLSLTLSLVMFLGNFIGYPRTAWINFAVLSLTYHNQEERIKRVKYRLPATIIGSISFYILFKYVVPAQQQMLFAMCLGFLMTFFSSYFNKTIMNSLSALVSSLLMYSLPGAVILRIASNTIGVLVVLVSERLFNRLFTRLDAKECTAN